MHPYKEATTFIGKDIVRINLGAGDRPMEGWINQDLYKNDGIYLVFDLNKKWTKIKTNSVDEYICLHTLEHLDDPIHFFREVQRTLKPGGKITIEVPFGNSDAAMSDPTHKRPYYLGSFTLFTSVQHDVCPTFNPQHRDNYPATFEIVAVFYIVEEYVKRFPFWRKWAIPLSKYVNNIVGSIRVVMVNNK